MKSCFCFSNIDDAIKVEEFLNKYFNVERDDYCDDSVLNVPRENYEEAITQGINFIITSNISSATWLDVHSDKIPIHSLPLLRLNIFPPFSKNKLFSNLTEKLCCKYAHDFQKLLGVPVIFEKNMYDVGEIVEFYLIRSPETINEHATYAARILRYLFTHNGISYISDKIYVCDAYGKNFRIL